MEFKSLKELCTITKGATGISKAIAGEFPLVVTSEERKSHNEFQFDAKAVIVPLVSSTGHGHASLKRIHYQEGKFALGSILCAIIPKDEEELSAEFLYHFLNLNKERELVSRMKGMANVTLPIKEIEKIKVPILTIDEQNQFVEYYSDIENHSNGISTEITHQLDLIKNLRQAFLREAMQGLLVSNETSDGKTGADLLAEIQAEKAQLVKEKKIKKPKPLAPITEEEIPFYIPKNWTWCRLGELGEFRRGPFGSTLKVSFFVKEGIKVYEQKNAIYDNHLLGEAFITEEKFQELKNFEVFPKDLIVSCSGATLGRIAELPENARQGIINQALMRIRLYQIGILNTYFIKLFRSPYMQSKIFEKAWGSAIPNMVGLVVFKEILIPLPPIEIQERIMAKLDELMGYCDALEEQVKQSQQTNELLLQQVLREALGA